MNRHVKAPTFADYSGKKVFLAGSIEMGAAPKWQPIVADALASSVKLRAGLTIIDPRRDDWDSSWQQRIDDPAFNEQVNWELSNIDSSDLIFFYLAPGTVSPISLMELGYVLGAKKQVVVCCPLEFARSGNVDVICARHNVYVHRTLESAIEAAVWKLRSFI